MAPKTSTGRSREAWDLARAQHGVVTRAQLLALGFSPDAIKHRLRGGRLRPLWRGVYAVGRLDLDRLGRWRAALLSCGEDAFLTHLSAAALYGIGTERPGGRVEVGVRRRGVREPDGIRLRRRPSLSPEEIGERASIPVTTPVQTMIDLATVQGPKMLLRSVNEADKLGVVGAEALRRSLQARGGVRGAPALRTLLDRDTFVLSDDELERLFLPLALESGLPLPLTKRMLNGYEVDFLWPDLRLVVETDGLRYHRTPAAQASDARRDQAHSAAGYVRLRFTHSQVTREPDWVRRVLGDTVARLARHARPRERSRDES